MKTVTFYHSVVCPRCHLSGIWLKQLLPEFPDVVLEKVEVLGNRARLKQAGVRSFPTLIAGDRRLSGFLLTPRGIRRFLAAL